MKLKTIVIVISVIFIVALIIILNLGCPGGYTEIEGECISIYKLNPVNVTLRYFVHEEMGEIIIELDSELNNYLSEKSDIVWYDDMWEDFILVNLNEEHQQEGLLLLVDKIRNITDNKDDQARIAISLVQHIPYDSIAVDNDMVEFKYPYETLYDNLGVCGDKSVLLSFLLKELGYGVVTYDYEFERHRAVGIACDSEYDYLDTGYCFIETNVPSIITDSFGEYPTDYMMSSGVEDYLLLGDPYEIVYISEGELFNAREEYKDMNRYNDLEYNFDEQEIKIDDCEFEIDDYKKRLDYYGDPVPYKIYDEYLDIYDESMVLYDEYILFHNKYTEDIKEYNSIIDKYNLDLK